MLAAFAVGVATVCSECSTDISGGSIGFVPEHILGEPTV